MTFQFFNHFLPAEDFLPYAVFEVDADVDDVIGRLHQIGDGIAGGAGSGFILNAGNKLSLGLEEARLRALVVIRSNVAAGDDIFARRR